MPEASVGIGKKGAMPDPERRQSYAFKSERRWGAYHGLGTGRTSPYRAANVGNRVSIGTIPSMRQRSHETIDATIIRGIKERKGFQKPFDHLGLGVRSYDGQKNLDRIFHMAKAHGDHMSAPGKCRIQTPEADLAYWKPSCKIDKVPAGEVHVGLSAHAAAGRYTAGSQIRTRITCWRFRERRERGCRKDAVYKDAVYEDTGQQTSRAQKTLSANE